MQNCILTKYVIVLKGQMCPFLPGQMCNFRGQKCQEPRGKCALFDQGKFARGR